MSSHAPGAIQVEKVLDDLIHRLVNSDNGAEVRAALIEARRLRNVAMRWAAIPPQPDARREMLARVMELIDTVNQTAERASGERSVFASPGAFTSVPPPAPGGSVSKPPVASKPPASSSPVPPRPEAKPLERSPERLPRSAATPREGVSAPPSNGGLSAPPPRAAASAPPPRPAASAPPPRPSAPPRAAIRDEPTVDERISAEPILDLGAPRVPAFDPAPASSPPITPKPLTLRPPSAPVEPFERSLSSAPMNAAKRVPIKAVPSARGEVLEGLSTTISSAQRRAVRDAPATSSTPNPPSAPMEPSAAPRKPPPLPKRSPSTASMAARSIGAASAAPESGSRAGLATPTLPPAGRARSAADVMTTLAEGISLVRAAIAEWQPHPAWAGTSMKLLYHNPENGGEYTALVKLGEGAVLPHRRHIKPEEMWMISGSATIGDHDVRVGEYVRAEAGSHHPRIASKQGCIFLLKGFDDDEILDSTPPAPDPDP